MDAAILLTSDLATVSEASAACVLISDLNTTLPSTVWTRDLQAFLHAHVQYNFVPFLSYSVYEQSCFRHVAYYYDAGCTDPYKITKTIIEYI